MIREDIYLAEGIKYVIEVDQNFSFRNFGDVVQALGGEIPDPILVVDKTVQ